jgi:GTP-binding protein
MAASSNSVALPVVAIVGRPNVGKSTLFNRLNGGKRAIVDDLPGVTRDRNYNEVTWRGHPFILIDTGGFEAGEEPGLKGRIREQSLLAVEEADVVLFLLDGKAGLNPLDTEAIRLLRHYEKPVFYAVNKLDTAAKKSRLFEFYDAGVTELFPLSAEHGTGLAELMQAVVAAFPQPIRSDDTRSIEHVRIAVLGRPNVGKSTLVNSLLGYDRSLVDSQPGTTRDALSSVFEWHGTPYELVDTAGIRRKARIVHRVERFSVIHALRSADRGDVLIYLLDGTEGVTDQDGQVLAYAFQRGKGLVIGINKWDLVSQDQVSVEKYRKFVQQKLAFVSFAPIVHLSALNKMGIGRLMSTVQQVCQEQRLWVKTPVLNRVVREVSSHHAPPGYRGHEVKIYYAVQTAAQPPTFSLFVNYPAGIHASYRRYLAQAMRQALGLERSPVRLVIRERREPRTRSRKN